MATKKQAKKIAESAPDDDFSGLIQSLTHVHEHLKFQAAKAVNVNLTLRNWIFGWRIKEYELKGRDRAKYGERLFAAIAEKLTGLRVSNCALWQLYRYRNFYLAFPEILGTLSPKLQSMLPGKLSPSTLGQLNTYVNWYKKNEAAKGDNPPIGLLLCTKKNHALVEYARAGIDNQLFISKYQLELPKKEEIAAFINKAARER